MRVNIHRGTKQIGGTCIELEAEGKRIALDVGLPLDADDSTSELDLLPEVKGFREPDEDLLGVVISHPHQDHFGLAHLLPNDVPVYIGESANNILKAASKYVPNGKYFDNTVHFENQKSFEIGPFKITPYLVDHSAFDAYSLLIEANGKRLFYSGDFRAHGRKQQLFERLVRNPPKDIDLLLMEGTTIGRTNTELGFPTESDLEEKFVADIKQTEGLYLIYTSAQNIDRVVTTYRAAKRTGRNLVIDLYTAVILEATGADTIPQTSWEGVNLFTPHAQRLQIKKNELFGDLKRHNIDRIYPEDLSSNPDKYVMLMRPWMYRDLEFADCLNGARFAYSMWSGYLQEERMIKFQKWLKKKGIPMSKIHTSGHAPVKDLKRLSEALAPKKLVPIHSFETDRFEEFFDNVKQKSDVEWWVV
ncbi:MBL fold metallo-hydrolase [Alphaproteobacteria bacterium 46_93_T64]|nr:MBL fold metallo-hydrolase [Alphaproteobacteria bacterium 46_93_T64]